MSSPNSASSLVNAIIGYVSRIIEVRGMKALLLDRETTSIVGIVYPQSKIISQEVFLVERVDNAGEKDVSMHHLAAIVFVRPSAESIAHVKRQLRKPRYKEYHLFFTNILSERQLEDLANADEFEVVKQVQEFYGDYYAVTADTYHLNRFHSHGIYQPRDMWAVKDQLAFRRNVDGIISALLSMKKRPDIRYSGSSDLSRSVAREVSQRINSERELFLFQQSSNPLLIVLDRRDDPVTPLLMQWTYQAMVHELLGIDNNRVDMRNVPDVRKEQREIVLSSEQDHFFKGSMHLNFGDLGASIRDLVENYQREMKSNQKIQSIEDMQRFVDNYPEFRSMAGNVSKHVALMGELSRLVELRNLMDVSSVEQELACEQDHGAALEKIMRLMDDHRLSNDDRLRLVMLYALRYETFGRNSLATLKGMLRDRATSDEARARVRAVDAVLSYAGQKVRGGDLFNNKNFWSRVGNAVSQGLKGVENIYTRHKPLLSTILDQVQKGRLKASGYPFTDGGNDRNRYDEIFVFIVGGVTYEESLAVAEINKSMDARVYLGGSCIHNSKSFIDDMLQSGEDEFEEKFDG